MDAFFDIFDPSFAEMIHADQAPERIAEASLGRKGRSGWMDPFTSTTSQQKG